MPGEYRSPGGGDNLFLASIVAVNAETGEYCGTTRRRPEDSWDFTATMPIILADLHIEGRTRKVLMQAPKNGFFYVIDRVNGQADLGGEVHAGESLGHARRPEDWPAGASTGSEIHHRSRTLMTPSVAGAHSWHPMAFNPNTGTRVFPARRSTGGRSRWIRLQGAGRARTAREHRYRRKDDAERAEMMKLADSRERGWLTAWDPVKQKEVWHVPQERAGNGGALTTAGNLVFAGTAAKQARRLSRRQRRQAVGAGRADRAARRADHVHRSMASSTSPVNAGWGGGWRWRSCEAGAGCSAPTRDCWSSSSVERRPCRRCLRAARFHCRRLQRRQLT